MKPFRVQVPSSGTERSIPVASVGREGDDVALITVDAHGEPTGALGAGWAEWQAKQSALHKSYIRTVSRGAILQIDVDVQGRVSLNECCPDRQGDVELLYLRSNTFGLGKVACWWDNKVGKVTELDGQWGVFAPAANRTVYMLTRVVDVPQNIG